MVIAFRRCCLDVAEFQEAFDMFDDNRDGKISRDELVKMMTRLGQMTSEEEITSIMTKADKDSTLYVTELSLGSVRQNARISYVEMHDEICHFEILKIARIGKKHFKTAF